MENIIEERKTLFGLMSEDLNNKRDQAPSFNHLTQNNTMPSPGSTPRFGPSPESIWTRSPLPVTPSTPLVYRCISSLRHQGNIYSVTVSKGLVFTGSNTSHIRAWQLLDCSEKGYIRSSTCKISSLLVHGDMLFSSHKDHKIRMWSLRDCDANFNPRKIITLPPKSSNPFKLLLMSKPRLRQHRDMVSCMAYNSDDGLLYTGSWDKTVKSWRLSDGKCVDSFVAHANNINDMVIDRDGFIITCSSDGTIKMWSRVCGETYHTLTMTLSFHPFPIYALAINEDVSSSRTFLYSGSSDGCINFWSQNFSERYSHGGAIQAHQFAILCLVTLENLVISGSEDAMIKIWKRGGEGKVYYECIVVLEGHKGPVKCLGACLEKDVNATGFLVFSASSDQTFKIWRVKGLHEMKEDVILQEMKRNSFDSVTNYEDDDAVDKKSRGFGLGPILSPSWVVKKLHKRSSNNNNVAIA
ncbi:protein JINGUBANG-like [Silene latifolia]|uniref:protein JINGUBANG-like n=1 Tax=Silene latifolia TaxID=37657 RepID=UPI003D76DCB1